MAEIRLGPDLRIPDFGKMGEQTAEIIIRRKKAKEKEDQLQLEEGIALEAAERQKKIEEGLKLSEKLRVEAEQRLTTIEAERRAQANVKRVEQRGVGRAIGAEARKVRDTPASRIARANLRGRGVFTPTQQETDRQISADKNINKAQELLLIPFTKKFGDSFEFETDFDERIWEIASRLLKNILETETIDKGKAVEIAKKRAMDVFIEKLFPGPVSNREIIEKMKQGGFEPGEIVKLLRHKAPPELFFELPGVVDSVIRDIGKEPKQPKGGRGSPSSRMTIPPLEG